MEVILDVRIGFMNSPREITFETDASVDEIETALHTSNEGTLTRLTDNKGQHFFVNPAAIAYVELGSETGRRVGFVS